MRSLWLHAVICNIQAITELFLGKEKKQNCNVSLQVDEKSWRMEENRDAGERKTEQKDGATRKMTASSKYSKFQ